MIYLCDGIFFCGKEVSLFCRLNGLLLIFFKLCRYSIMLCGLRVRYFYFLCDYELIFVCKEWCKVYDMFEGFF